ncbi:MAG: hypothetical protein HQM00_15415 [Magnetococcales bacterium]|nr:hypothetical protein [Magnetococcales bacterium]
MDGLKKLWEKTGSFDSVEVNKDFERRRDEVRNRLAQEGEERKKADIIKKQQAIQQAELVARLEAEKIANEARLAAMTPNRQQIEKFCVNIDKITISRQVGGELWNTAHNLIKAAESGGWSQEEKKELLAVCEQNLPPKLKEDAKKQKILFDRLRAVMS